jgi:hypothetical protein
VSAEERVVSSPFASLSWEEDDCPAFALDNTSPLEDDRDDDHNDANDLDLAHFGFREKPKY